MLVACWMLMSTLTVQAQAPPAPSIINFSVTTVVAGNPPATVRGSADVSARFINGAVGGNNKFEVAVTPFNTVMGNKMRGPTQGGAAIYGAAGTLTYRATNMQGFQAFYAEYTLTENTGAVTRWKSGDYQVP